MALLACLTRPTCSQNTPATELPPPRPTLTDADNFFIEYQRAADFVRRHALAEASLVMEALRQRLTTSPWLELTLLKRSELLEARTPAQAMEGYQLVLNRLLAEAYYQTDETGLLRQAIQGETERGVRRMRLKRLDAALGRYFVRFQKYPENLAMLVTHQMLDPVDLVDARQQQFLYTPKSQALGQHSFMGYDLERVPSEPFSVSSPRIPSTTKISDDPPRYAALLQPSTHKDPEQILEGQALGGYHVAAVGARGVIVCTHNRVLILPVAR